MFTGLIEEIGRISGTGRRGNIANFTIEAVTVLDDLSIGDSVALNGACLTVTVIGGSGFTVQAVEETLTRTTLCTLKRGSSVNLERALRLGDRLGGHLVQGHVDGTGQVLSIRKSGDNTVITISAGHDIERYIVEKGSITIDGVSLTVTSAGNGEFSVSVIPHTLSATTLRDVRKGHRVNMEIDILAKYVEKLLHTGDSLTIDRLEKLGF